MTSNPAHLHDLMALACDWYWESDASGRITTLVFYRPFANGACQLWQRGALLQDIIAKTQWGGNSEDAVGLIERRMPFRDVMVKNNAIGGQSCSQLLTARPVMSSEGIFKGYTGIGRDVSHQVNAMSSLLSPPSIDASLSSRNRYRYQLENKLQTALLDQKFYLDYQPLVDMRNGKIIGAEALIRWQDEELGMISPSDFIPLAEENGLIVPLGEWIMRSVCKTRQHWKKNGLVLPVTAVNVSTVQLSRSDFVDFVLATLEEFDVQPQEIEIEVTETNFLESSTLAQHNLERLRQAGILAALDDFGVGHSNLAHLRDLPIDRLKIDRSFTTECMKEERTLIIVKAVIEMARSLGLHVTVEGIETQMQQTWMAHLKCESAQGYLFSRPISDKAFLKLFQEGEGRERTLMH